MTKTILGGAVAAALLLSAGAGHARGPTPNLTEQERMEAENPVRPLRGSNERADCSDPLNQRQGGVDLRNATCPSGRNQPPPVDYNGGLHPRTH